MQQSDCMHSVHLLLGHNWQVFSCREDTEDICHHCVTISSLLDSIFALTYT